MLFLLRLSGEAHSKTFEVSKASKVSPYLMQSSLILANSLVLPLSVFLTAEDAKKARRTQRYVRISSVICAPCL